MTELTCIVCPRGCHLTVDEAKDYAVRGNACPRGAEYGKAELCAPTRTLTTTVRLTGGALPRVPVRTAAPIPKDKMSEAMAAINAVTAAAPVHIGDVLLPDLLGTGVDVIATRDMERV